jgi:hypothetical protein
MSSPTSSFVSRALQLVQREAPRCAAALGDALGPIVLDLVIDGEHMWMTSVAGRVAIGPARDPRDPEATILAEVVTRGAVVLALVDGTDALLPAILANRVRVRTPPAHAHRLFEVVNRFVEGCARAPGGPALLDAFRGHVSTTDERS